jgi:hypothetical protein
VEFDFIEAVTPAADNDGGYAVADQVRKSAGLGHEAVDA